MNWFPIPFTGPMVRAVRAVESPKTCTRRIFKLPRGCSWYEALGGEDAGWLADDCETGWAHVSELRSPYGSVGDRLWVREHWRVKPAENGKPPRDLAQQPVWYVADNEPVPAYFDGGRFRHGMFMPRWASRLSLEITATRVERLHEITDEGARAEGATGGHGVIPGYLYCATPLEHFRHIWSGINGSESWDSNPLVWAIDFRRVF